MEKFITFPNIRRYREANGLTVQHMAEKSKISVDQYVNIESGKSPVTNEDLYVISKALNVRVSKLTYYENELQNVRFRSNKKLNKRNLIILETAHWLNEYKFIEDLLGEHLSNPLDDIWKYSSRKGKKIKDVAKYTREKFGISAEEPISNLCSILESNGIKIGEHEVKSHDFFGLSIGPADGGPAIVVNNWNQIPVERWIFTTAHELGHLVLHYSDFNVDKTKEGKVHENEANNFASEFLMPDASFIKAWNDTKGLSVVDRVIKVKRIFRVSYKTVLYRYTIHFPDSVNIWARFHSDYKRIYKKPLLHNVEPEALVKDAFRASFPEHRTKDEPENLTPADFRHGRLISLVMKALEKKEISIGRGVELLQTSHQELRELAKSWYC